MTFEPAQDEMILARINNSTATSSYFNAKFLCIQGDIIWVIEEGEDTPLAVNEMQPLPAKPEPIPFTHETWPRQVVYIRPVTDNYNKFLVIGFYSSGVRVARDKISFSILDEFYEISLDFYQTWKPCHYVPEQN